MSSVERELHEQNRRSWNAATRAHNSHKRDQAAFLRNGGSTLFPEELELAGALSGRSLLHLCCNAGQDTLSLARLGARTTGVDISDEAIAFAEKLSIDSGIAGEFERADLYDWLPRAAKERRRFDRVFMSYGVLGWMSDLPSLFRGIAGVLEHGGRVVCLEFHPALMMFDDTLQLRYPYFRTSGPYTWQEGVSDYVALSGAPLTPSGWLDGEQDFKNPHPVHEFPWALSELVAAVLEAGLQIAELREWPWANGFKPFKAMRALPGNRYAAPEGMPELPLMIGMVAARP
jgi:SAM-dependent methyltransferase